MTLMGHQISYVIYYQLQGHLTIIFNVLFSFSISERTDVAFFWYEYLRGWTCTSDSTKFWVPIPYLKNSNSSVAGEDPEGVNRLFSRCEKRYFVSEMVWLPMILDCWSFVRCDFVSRPFSTNKVTNKNRLFRNPKGTPYSRHCLFKLRKRAGWQRESWRAQLDF